MRHLFRLALLAALVWIALIWGADVLLAVGFFAAVGIYAARQATAGVRA